LFLTPVFLGLLAALVSLAPAPAPAGEKGKDPQIGQTFRVPYRLTLTNHYLVRVRINGQGPFNFLVDTGAPALFIGTEAARQIGLEPDPKAFWTPVERFDIEGGAVLRNIKARVEDPFQLEGMNALGLPGATIDGILGFTVLARFRMEFDPTRDRMNWTRLNYDPKEPFVPRDAADRQPPAGVQAMNLLGPAMKLMAVFVGKQPEDVLHPQGLLGLELAEAKSGDVRVEKVLPGTPAESAGVKPGDLLVGLHDRSVDDLTAAHAAIARVRPGDKVTLTLKRDGQTLERTLTATEGF
jgi:hypothetical protein